MNKEKHVYCKLCKASVSQGMGEIFSCVNGAGEFMDLCEVCWSKYTTDKPQEENVILHGEYTGLQEGDKVRLLQNIEFECGAIALVGDVFVVALINNEGVWLTEGALDDNFYIQPCMVVREQ